MEINIDNEHEHKLFERKEIAAHASFDSKTPTREEVKQAICRKKNINPEMLEIISIDQAYGAKECSITAYEYTTKEARERGAFRMGSKKKTAQPAAAKQEAAQKEEKPKSEAHEKHGHEDENKEKQETAQHAEHQKHEKEQKPVADEHGKHDNAGKGAASAQEKPQEKQ